MEASESRGQGYKTPCTIDSLPRCTRADLFATIKVNLIVASYTRETS